MSEPTQSDYDAALVATLLDGPLNVEGWKEKASLDMASAARRIQSLTQENERLQGMLKRFCLFAEQDGVYSSLRIEAQALLPTQEEEKR